MIVNNRLLKGFIYLCISLGCPLLSTGALAEGIEIQSASTSLIGDVYSVDADIDIELDEEVQDALEHGVELNIDFTIVIKRSRSWLWDPTIIENILHYKLEYYPLTDLYLITNQINDNRSQFETLEQATRYLGKIRNHIIINQASLEPDESYIGLIQAKLNIENLPPPLQPTAHLSERWHLESSWYEWEIR